MLTDEEKYTRHCGSADFRAVRREVPAALRSVVVRGRRGREAQEGQRLHRLHPDRRPRPHRRRIEPRRAADPQRPPDLGAGDRGSWRRVLPAVRRGDGGRLGGEGPRARRSGQPSARRTELNFRRRTSKTADDHRPRLAGSRRRGTGRSTRCRTCSSARRRCRAATARPASPSGSTRGAPDDDQARAAGLLITTTASDSEGTLGGLVDLVASGSSAALVARRGSPRAGAARSDPICSHRRPRGQGGLPPRRRLPLLPVRQRDQLRADQPVPRPTAAARPDGRSGHRDAGSPRVRSSRTDCDARGPAG